MFNDGDGVERDVSGNVVAFRIWKAGPNVTDKGVHIFSAESARLLLEEQATRGNRISVDVDHLSLSADAPPEARRAVGWHRLAVRAGELWAVACEWTEVARSGLASSPPGWKHYSAVYDVTKDGEIVSFTCGALTNNPATWNATELARRPTAAAVLASRARALEAQAARLERELGPAAVAQLLASRRDIGPALRRTLAKMPLELLRSTLAGIPRK